WKRICLNRRRHIDLLLRWCFVSYVVSRNQRKEPRFEYKRLVSSVSMESTSEDKSSEKPPTHWKISATSITLPTNWRTSKNRLKEFLIRPNTRNITAVKRH